MPIRKPDRHEAIQKPNLRYASVATSGRLLVVSALFLLIFCGCQPKTPTSAGPTIASMNGRTMGTSYSVKFETRQPESLAEVGTGIEKVLKRVNDQMSTYITESELSMFNQSESKDWFEVSAETAQVALLAKEISGKCDGAFDVTCGPLVELWGFGSKGRRESPPEASEIESALELVGDEKLSVRMSPPALRKATSGLQVDLSAIAKGHGVDRIAAFLEASGIFDYFVEIGGEIRCSGNKGGQPWKVGIEDPFVGEQGGQSLQFVIDLTDAALATSGNYRNYFEVDGVRFAHTLDPKTGQPTRYDIASSTAVADTCAEADGIATAMMAAGFVDGKELAERNGWAVLLVAPPEASDETQRTFVSSAFKKRIPNLGVVGTDVQ